MSNARSAAPRGMITRSLASLWVFLTAPIQVIPLPSQRRNERLKVIASLLARDAFVTGDPRLQDLAQNLEQLRRIRFEGKK